MALYELHDVVKAYGEGAGVDPRRRRHHVLRSTPASSSSSRVPAARASRRCCNCSARSTVRRAGSVMFEGNDLATISDRHLAELRLAHVRVRVPAVQPRTDALRGGERRDGARAARWLAASPRGKRALRAARRCRPERSRRPPTEPALGRRAAARRDRARVCRRARASSSPTSPLATSTPAPGKRSWTILRRLVDRDWARRSC